ncbi:putative lipid II flippase FtsW [Candidatus Uhrbacteria bacterium CG10_big_fil_rev_8_21_14_0_10_50_16]|uniref:Probable peptidoglycan glycosyltransferase FtsW n=1 Tax=Candidatus Uhrbacteria bacterium CG10_big_fil_rev_8_21_14_0_10_50_16 TaxID=1975039 RepID=A0A2H0RLK9_9BACT|nr:MAG: putative lipid II flippase FtsW [Candidatus Uhrbacteria bacterium CG10_big_fil_rev_8_21_14_0_10_50_16]
MLKPKHAIDYRLLALVGGLLLFGLAMLMSASGPLGFERFGDTYWFIKHQVIFGVLPGLVGMFVMSRIPFTFWRNMAGALLIISIVLLILVFIPGIGADFGTAHSWIAIGGLSFQPAEIVKLTFLLYLAAWFERRTDTGIKDANTGLIPFVTVLGIIMLLMILQPDIGTMAVIVMIALTVYFVAGAPWPHLFLLGGGGATLFFLLIRLAPYRAARFTTFLHPELDPQGVGYHINQALLAIGSGGFLGLGYGHSRQKFQYLPEVAGDSIFAVIAEELGFVLTAAVIVTFAFFARQMLRIATHAPDKFSQFVVVGVMTWILFQAFVNIGAMLALLPITGIPLSFISYGGTSMVMMLSAMGIVLNISSYRT